ncbi:MAG: trigger factor [Patescibacteria group bacterium]
MSEIKKYHQNIKVTRLPNAEIEIEGEIAAERMDVLRNKALQKFAHEIEIPGFRKGHTPLEIVTQKVGEIALLEEAAEIALGEEYPIILLNEKIHAIGTPKISITKIAKGNPLGFKIHTFISPTISLTGYKEIAKKEISKKDDIEVTEKEIEQVIAEIQKQKIQKEGGKETTSPSSSLKTSQSLNDLPALTDEFVKTLGKFNDISDFKNKIKENLEFEKKVRAREKKRASIIDELVKIASIALPSILVESELIKMVVQFTDEVEAAGMKYADYLKQINKSEEDVRKEWRPTAEKRAKTQVILDEIALKEKIEPEKDQVEKEVEHLITTYPGTDKERVRIYISTVLRNAKVFEFLESQK